MRENSFFIVFLLAAAVAGVGGCGGTDPSGNDDGDGSGGRSTGGPGGTGGRAAAGGSAAGSGGSNSSCSNVRPTGTMWDEATCDQWAADTMECDADWMVEGEYCNLSCGRCEAGSSGGGSSGVGGSDPVSVDHGKFVGNITTRNQVDSGNLKFADYWDQITPENAGKWGEVQGSPGGPYNWATLDAIYDYATTNRLLFKQHAFVWGQQQPSGQPNEQQLKDWMRSFCSRYPDTQMIDVVNEPPPHTTPSYANSIGGGTDGDWQWITNSFVWAREYCPQAILILNDYNNIEWQGDNQHFIDIVNTVLENGGPIDAVGAQAHDLDEPRVSFETVQMLLQKLHDDTGLPVYISELDLSYTDDATQLSMYEQYFPFFMEQDYIPGITIWGWIYGSTWSQAPDSGLVRNGQSRSAMRWLMDELGRPSP